MRQNGRKLPEAKKWLAYYEARGWKWGDEPPPQVAGEGITSQASEGEDLTWNVREGKMQDAAGNFYYLGEDGLYHRE